MNFANAIAQQRPSLDAVEARVFALTNELRREARLTPLTSDPRLTEAARAFSRYVARTDKLEHEADGTTPADRAQAHGYAYCIVAENLAYEYSSVGFESNDLAGRFVSGWEQSPTHRANMLHPDVTQVGVAVSAGVKSGEYYVVQMLARPMSARIKFTVEPHGGFVAVRISRAHVHACAETDAYARKLRRRRAQVGSA